MPKDLTAYSDALGLVPGAGPLEIQRAYRRLMRRWHPDLFNPGSPMQATAEDITKAANEAFEQAYGRLVAAGAARPIDGAAEAVVRLQQAGLRTTATPTDARGLRHPHIRTRPFQGPQGQRFRACGESGRGSWKPGRSSKR